MSGLFVFHDRRAQSWPRQCARLAARFGPPLPSFSPQPTVALPALLVLKGARQTGRGEDLSSTPHTLWQTKTATATAPAAATASAPAPSPATATAQTHSTRGSNSNRRTDAQTHRHTDTENADAQTQTHTYTHRRTDTQTHRHTDTHTRARVVSCIAECVMFVVRRRLYHGDMHSGTASGFASTPKQKY